MIAPCPASLGRIRVPDHAPGPTSDCFAIAERLALATLDVDAPPGAQARIRGSHNFLPESDDRSHCVGEG